jgi:2-oxopent-4-enoate/cis-2-oxohex-4-enoate hydratase
MTPDTITRYSDELFAALRERHTVAPLTEREAEITIEDAYLISRGLLARREAEGERVIGKKIGVTSKPVQRMLGVHQPDFGYLTDRMKYPDGAELPISKLMIQPRAEGEIAFLLKHDLVGPGVGIDEVLDATERVFPCFEIVDSRIRDWKITIYDTIADNASSGLFVIGGPGAGPRDVDLVTCGMVVEKNGEIISTGAGAAALGSPAFCVAWLANTLGGFGIPLLAREIVLSGSLVPLEPVVAGDQMHLKVGGLGTASVRFV